MKTLLIALAFSIALCISAFAQTKDEFRAMTTENKVTLWKAHFADVLANEPLTDAQRSVIYQAI